MTRRRVIITTVIATLAGLVGAAVALVVTRRDHTDEPITSARQVQPTISHESGRLILEVHNPNDDLALHDAEFNVGLHDAAGLIVAGLTPYNQDPQFRCCLLDRLGPGETTRFTIVPDYPDATTVRLKFIKGSFRRP